MKQEKITQNKKHETSRIIGKVETMKEDNKKLLSPKGAIVFSEQLVTTHQTKSKLQLNLYIEGV